jgi:outer membrane protein
MTRPVAAAILVAGLASLRAPSSARCEEPPARAVSLEAILALAKSGPDSVSAEREAESAHQESEAVWRGAFMPKVVGVGLGARLSDPVMMENPLSGSHIPPALGVPTGDILLLGRDALLGRLELKQPLLDVPGMFYGSAAAANLAAAAKLKASRDKKDNQGKAVGYYLQSLGLRARRVALENYVHSLEDRRNEIRRLYELGGVSEADLLKVKLGIDDANQAMRAIREKESFLGRMMAQTVGENGSLVPEDLPADLPVVKEPDPVSAQEREDIQALDRQIESADLRRKAALSTVLPTVDAFAGVTYVKQDVLTDNRWEDIGVRLAWPIFDGAIGAAKASALDAEREALVGRKRSAELVIDAQRESARKTLAIKRQEYSERLQGVIDAKTASDLDFKRLREGKVTVSNFLDSADMLRDRQEKAAISKVNWYEEWFLYQSAIGQEPTAP